MLPMLCYAMLQGGVQRLGIGRCQLRAMGRAQELGQPHVSHAQSLPAAVSCTCHRSVPAVVNRGQPMGCMDATWDKSGVACVGSRFSAIRRAGLCLPWPAPPHYRCSHWEDAGVTCFNCPSCPTQHTLRLAGNTTGVAVAGALAAPSAPVIPTGWSSSSGAASWAEGRCCGREGKGPAWAVRR